MKRWRGVRDGEIKTKASVCLLPNAHTWCRRSRQTLQLVIGVLLQRWKKRDRQPCCFFILVPVFTRV